MIEKRKGVIEVVGSDCPGMAPQPVPSTTKRGLSDGWSSEGGQEEGANSGYKL